MSKETYALTPSSLNRVVTKASLAHKTATEATAKLPRDRFYASWFTPAFVGVCVLGFATLACFAAVVLDPVMRDTVYVDIAAVLVLITLGCLFTLSFFQSSWMQKAREHNKEFYEKEFQQQVDDSVELAFDLAE